MGLFDSIRCDYPLPGDPPSFLKNAPFFQTKDLGEGMGDYYITKDGELYLDFSGFDNLKEVFGEGKDFVLKDKKINISKKIEFYGSNLRAGKPRGKNYIYFTDDGNDYVAITYLAQFKKGKLISIKEKHREEKQAEKYEIH